MKPITKRLLTPRLSDLLPDIIFQISLPLNSRILQRIRPTAAKYLLQLIADLTYEIHSGHNSSRISVYR
jgi:hypothetical protein